YAAVDGDLYQLEIRRCQSAAECDDGDACTIDSCAPFAEGATIGGCLNQKRTGFASVQCAFVGDVKVSACNGQTLPVIVRRMFSRANGLVDRASTAKPKKAKKLLRVAARALNKAIAATAKAGQSAILTRECS